MMSTASSFPPNYHITASLSPSNPIPRWVEAISGTSSFSSLRNASVLLFQSKMRTRPTTKRRKHKQLFPVMEWQDCSAQIEIDVPCSVAYECYSDRETIPKWMFFISSVKVLEDKPDQSRWALKYEMLGREVEFSWLARNLQPIPNQKIHWRSLDGLPNRGSVRFLPKSPSSCRIQLTVSYELPKILIPAGVVIKPHLEGLLVKGLEQFAAHAKDSQRNVPQN